MPAYGPEFANDHVRRHGESWGICRLRPRWPGELVTQSSGKARYVTFFRDTAVKLPVKRIIVGPADGADERCRALSRRLQ
jgi:hypothetical protein